MTKAVITAHHGDPISKVRGLVRQHGVHHIPVVNGDQLVGIVSWTDILRVSFGDAFNTDERTVDATLASLNLQRGMLHTAAELGSKLFRRTPLMPILGNHDREITSRGPKPPAHAVYDIEAKAYRDFFALPDVEWRWRFDIPDFSLRLLALDAAYGGAESHLRRHAARARSPPGSCSARRPRSL